MKKLLLLAVVIGSLANGCGGSYSWHWKLQNGYFDENGNRAGFSAAVSCTKQGRRESGGSIFGDCSKNPKCRELAEICMKERGFIEAKTFETTEERMALYQKAYEEGWIKPGMTKIEVVNLIGAPQIITISSFLNLTGTVPRKAWWYCRSAAKTALIGYNFILQITWVNDRVESVDRKFRF